MHKFLKYLKISILPNETIVAFTQLNEIDFSGNKIKKFSTYLFKIFPNVKKIDLSNNKIKHVSSDYSIETMKYFDGNVIINFDGNPIVNAD